MRLSFLKAKIHRATVTDANLHYQGSITLGRELLEASGIRPFEQVHIYNITNGERFETYALEGPTGTVCINGAAAWKARVNDRVIIAAYCSLEESEVATHHPKLVFVNEENAIQSVTDHY